MTILLAEDDQFTRQGLTDLFTEEGHTVMAAKDGEEAVRLFSGNDPDLIILDIMMPVKNGYEVCKIIRKKDRNVPVIFLSAKSEEIDKVLGLELGADDYISKPFGVREMIARVNAVCRRANTHNEEAVDIDPSREEPFRMDDLEIRPAELTAFRGEKKIDLSPRDMKILILFSRNRGRVLDRDTIYNAGWGLSHLANSRTLDQHISQLRKKIEKEPRNPTIIVTVPTAGYRFPD